MSPASDGRLHVLCVDDEPRVLEGLALNLRRLFRVSTALNGQAALAIVDGNDPPAVVVSDMRMPEMDGAALLSQVYERAPDVIRILLTGHADLESAIAAVNHGQIFRFLTKPCPSETLIGALQAAAEQRRLLEAERVLLEQTLRGVVKTLTDMLSLANPLAFGRALRLKHHAAELMAALRLPTAWQVEVAAMMSQLGCIALAPETHEKLYHGRPLDADEAARVRQLPELALQVLGSIPRLDAVRAILLHQGNRFDGAGSPAGAPKGDALPVGARVLKIALDYDVLEASGCAPAAALAEMAGRPGAYDAKLLAAFAHLRGQASPPVPTQLALDELRPGMVLPQGVVTKSGLLLVARGQEVTAVLLQKLRNIPSGSLSEPIAVHVPR